MQKCPDARDRKGDAMSCRKCKSKNCSCKDAQDIADENANRGPRGFRGATGPTGPCCTGPTGPQGPTGAGAASDVIPFAGTTEVILTPQAPIDVGFAPLVQHLFIPAVPAGSPVDRLAFIAPRPGVLRNLYLQYVVLRTPGLAPGGTIRAEVYVNGTDVPGVGATGIFVDFTNAGAVPIIIPPSPLFAGSNTANSFAVAVGDRVALRISALTPQSTVPSGLVVSAGLEYA